MTRKNFPGELIGYRKNGRPIYNIAGGSVDMPEALPNSPVPPVAPAQPAPPASGPWYTKDDIEEARKQEKDKLYDRLSKQGTKINALEEQIKQWQSEREAAEEARKAAEREADEAKRRQAEEEMGVRELLAKREQHWNDQLDAVRRENEQKLALLEKERQFATLQAYIQRRVGEEREAIAPQLIDLIDGNTPEEVDASINLMKQKTAEISAQLQNASVTLAANMRGVSPNGYAADGPLDNNPAITQISNEELRSMPNSVYAKHREQLLGSAAQGNGGLFG